MRVTLLDSTGVPLDGYGDQLLIYSVIEFTASPVYESSEERVILSNCGGLAAATKSAERFKWIDISLSLTNPDVELVTALTAGTSVLTSGLPTGYVYPAVGAAPSNGVALELWTKAVVMDSQVIGSGAWWRWTFPKAVFSFDPGTIGNDLQRVVLNGFMLENANAGTGPQGDWPPEASLGSPSYFRDYYLPSTASGVVSGYGTNGYGTMAYGT